MKFFTASIKFLARTANDKAHEKRLIAAKDSAYSKTGNDLKSAKKEGRYVDGQRQFRKNYAKSKKKADLIHTRINDFINDL